MINYGYFRHRFDASSDPKLQSLIDDMGISALGYYYSLLELYGSHYAQKKQKNEVEIHRRVIANMWRKRVDSCDKVLTKLQLSGLIVYTKSKNTYLLDIPNFLKYYGSYQKTTSQKSPNKRKENKIKLNKIKKEEVEEINALDHYQEILKEWNDVAKKNNLRVTHDNNENRYFFSVAFSRSPDVNYWKKVIHGVTLDPFFMGANNKGFKATFDYILKDGKSSRLYDIYEENKDILPKFDGEKIENN